MKQHQFGDGVIYVEGGRRSNAFVLQSTIHQVSGEEEEHLILAVPDSSKAAAVMSGNQIQDAIIRVYGVRPLAKTKPANDEAGTMGTGWAESSEIDNDSEAMKAGPLLTDLVHEINATNPVDATGHDLKDSDKFKAAAKYLGVEVSGYDKNDNHYQITQELQKQGVIHPASPKPEQVTDRVATPEPTDESSQSEGKSQEQVAMENEALRDPSKAAQFLQPNDLNNMPQATKDAVERGELDPVAINNTPEDHPEFGQSVRDQQEAKPYRVEERDGKFFVVDANGEAVTNQVTENAEEYDTREQAEAALSSYNDDQPE